MNLKMLASHTVDLDLLPDDGTVLDVGCRFWDFSRWIFHSRPRARIYALDPARDVQVAGDDVTAAFLPVALVGTHGRAFRQLAHFSTGEGDFLTDKKHFPGWDIQPELYEVPCLTIQEVMEANGVTFWDLVKLDCEGSEFDILENWPGPIARQISVEFHDWDKPNYRSETYYEALWRRLPWYKVVQHELSKQGEGVGHWDTLLVLR